MHDPTLTPVVGDPFAGPWLSPVDGDPFQQTMALQDYARSLPIVPAQPLMGQAGGAPLDDFTETGIHASAPQPTFPGLAGVAGDPSRSMAIRLPAAIGSSLADQGVGLAKSAWGAATLPGDVARGLVDPNSLEAVRRSTDLAGLLTLPAAETGAVADPNALGIFAGAKAKTADLGALATAQDLAAKGADKTAIWNQTGWFTGADGKWRYEIPDNTSRLMPDLKSADVGERTDLEFALKHPDLYAAYPQAQDIGVVKMPFPANGVESPAAYAANKNIIGLNSDMQAGRPATQVRSDLLHETQHAVQRTEGFGAGANYDAVKNSDTTAYARLASAALKVQNRVSLLGEDPWSATNFIAGNESFDPVQLKYWSEKSTDELNTAARQTPMTQYMNTSGEVEARNVQSRMNMTPAQRQATPPWLTQDTPNEQQIVRFSPGGPQLSLIPVDHDPFAGPTKAQPTPAPPSVTAYHGSPHSFDQFDLSKIGTGEGAQAYGHGLYFAGNEDVARAYRNALSSDALQMPDGSVQRVNTMGDLEELSPKLKDILDQNGANDKLPNNVRQLTMSSDVHSLIDDAFFNADNTNTNRNMLESAVDYLRGQAADPAHMDGVSSKDLRDVRNAYTLAADRLASLHEQIKPVPGSMYQVAINADPEHFLDWDKPLSEQHPKVQNALSQFGVTSGRGDQLHDMLTNALAKKDRDNLLAASKQGQDSLRSYLSGPEIPYQVQAATALRDAGVPGIKYLDAGSRTAGDGSKNYVVFDAHAISILKKYGLAGLGIGAGGAALMGQPHPAQASGVRLTLVSGDPFAQ